jgi:hypothetical protein
VQEVWSLYLSMSGHGELSQDWVLPHTELSLRFPVGSVTLIALGDGGVYGLKEMGRNNNVKTAQ